MSYHIQWSEDFSLWTNSTKPPLQDCAPQHEFCSQVQTFKVLNVSLFSIVSLFPILLFLLFLIFKLQIAIKFLKKTNGTIIRTFYTYTWMMTIFNLISIASRTLGQLFWVSDDADNVNLFRVTSLINETFMLYIEISVILILFGGKLSQKTNLCTTTIFSLICTNLFLLLRVCFHYFSKKQGFEFFVDPSLIEPSHLARISIVIEDSIFFLVYFLIIFLVLFQSSLLPSRKTIYIFFIFNLFILFFSILGNSLLVGCLSM
jgi:hypothetical protein